MTARQNKTPTACGPAQRTAGLSRTASPEILSGHVRASWLCKKLLLTERFIADKALNELFEWEAAPPSDHFLTADEFLVQFSEDRRGSPA